MKKWYAFFILIVILVISALSCAMVKDDGLYAKRQHVSQFSTSFVTSADNRKHNIVLAVSKFSWVIVQPNEQLSFNNVVGKRNEENGYKKSVVISYGEYVEGIGGGVCQVSTTLYNAWIRAGLDVLEVKNHTLPASYVKLSCDATVSDYQDLILVNNSKCAVIINGYTKNESIFFDIYGEKPRYEIKILSKTINKISPGKANREIVSSFGDNMVYNNGKEDYIILKNSKDGYHSQAYIQYYDNNQLLYQKLIRDDYYAPIIGIIGVLS